MTKKNKDLIELRLILTPDETIYTSFNKIKESLGVKSNAEVLRFILNQIGKFSLVELGIKEDTKTNSIVKTESI